MAHLTLRIPSGKCAQKWEATNQILAPFPLVLKEERCLVCEFRINRCTSILIRFICVIVCTCVKRVLYGK